jgi:hypothetical protein
MDRIEIVPRMKRINCKICCTDQFGTRLSWLLLALTLVSGCATAATGATGGLEPPFREEVLEFCWAPQGPPG